MYLYGPFKVAGVHTSASNHRFDASLRERMPQGCQKREDVVSVAKGYGFPQFEIHDMPATTNQ